MIKVILDRIMVKPVEIETTRKVEGSNIEIAIAYGDKGEVRHKASRVEGTVVGIGPLAYKDIGDGTPPVQVGDFVVFAKYAGVFVTDPDTDEDLVILNDEDVLCVVTKTGEK